ncbi:hypothetical protein XCR_3296 [Xanthomonas campestris pv. raphani 756C]|nr:hypothetical protein XCR_3296 [Xanthomonas campestris pv. raphani 756C]
MSAHIARWSAARFDVCDWPWLRIRKDAGRRAIDRIVGLPAPRNRGQSA